MTASAATSRISTPPPISSTRPPPEPCWPRTTEPVPGSSTTLPCGGRNTSRDGGSDGGRTGSSRLQRWAADLRELLGAGFLRNVIGTLGSRAVMVVLRVVTAVIVTRAFGPQGRGLYATAVALSAIGVQVGNMGLHASNTWAVARDRSLLGALIANSLLASLVIGSVMVALLLAIVAIWPGVAPLDLGLLLLALVSIPIGIAYLLLQNLLLGTERIRAYNLWM